jgi:hypothetical protein
MIPCFRVKEGKKMDFGDVLKAIRRDGFIVRRPRWQDGQGLGIICLPPLEDGRLSLIFSDGEYTPWIPSNADLLAEDWEVVVSWVPHPRHLTRQDVALLQQGEVPFCPHCLAPADGNMLIVQVG